MHKRAVALVLSLAIIHINSYEAVLYAEEYLDEKQTTNEQTIESTVEETIEEVETKEENKVQEMTEETGQEISTHSVNNLQELNDAINIANFGDVIKIYPGDYATSKITISKSGITLQGCTQDGQPVTNKRDAVYFDSKLTINASDVEISGLETQEIVVAERSQVSNVTVKDGYVIGNIYIAHQRGAITNNVTIENLTASGGLYVAWYANANNTTLKNIKCSSINASSTSDGIIDNLILDGCEIDYSIQVSGNNNKIINTTAKQGLRVGSSDTLVDNCTMLYIEVGYNGDVVNNVTIQNTKASRRLEIGSSAGRTTDITVDNVEMDTLYVGESNGIATNVTINNSNITGYAGIGRNERGRAYNTTLNNTTIANLSIGIAGGIAENTVSRNTTIKTNLVIQGAESDANNTFIHLNIDPESTNSSPTITDNGNNTVIVKNLTSNSTKFTAQASQGLRVELIKDSEVLINKVVGEDKIIDEYLRENDKYFTLDAGDQVNVRVYNAQDAILYNEDLIVQKTNTKPTTPTVNPITNTSTSIRGKSVKYLTVVAEQDGVELGRVNVDNDGNFEIPLKEPLREYSSVQVYAINKDNINSDIVWRDVQDVISPEAPIVDGVTTKSRTVTGKAEPNSRVTVSVTVNGNISYYGDYADGNGSFEVDLGRLIRKNDVIDVYVSDEAGNKSDTVRIESITEILPKQPIVKDTITNASQTITGKAEPNCDIYSYINGKLAMATESDSEGNFTLSVPWVNEYNIRMEAGTEVEIHAMDSDGDRSKVTTVTVEDVRPKPVSKIDDIYNISNTITGIAESNREIIAFLGEEELGRGTSDSLGNFEITIQNTLEQDTEVSFIVSGDNNILSEIKSSTVKDKIPPTIERIDEVSNTRSWISGKSEPGSTVYVLREGQSEEDEDIASGRAYDNGEFEINISGLVAGETLRIYAKDKSDNRSEVVEVMVMERTTPYININPIDLNDKVIEGQSREGSTVTAYLEDKESKEIKEIGSSIVKPDGRFAIDITENLKYQDIVIVKVIDIHGNKGETFRDVGDYIAPYFEKIDDIHSQSKKVTGKVTKANSNILLRYLDQYGNYLYDLGQGVADENGNFSIKLSKKLDVSYQVDVVAYDSVGNYSTWGRTVYYIKEFKDIEEHWAREEIYSFINKGYIGGYPDNTFKPDNQITRAEFVKIVNGVFGYSEKGEVKFTDVKESEWYYDEVAKAVKAGYINGKTETTFDPMAPITRQEASKIIATIKSCTDEDYDKINSFDDSGSVASWAKPYVEGVLEKGYMNGYDDNTFKPEQRITRAEAVVTLGRTIR